MNLSSLSRRRLLQSGLLLAAQPLLARTGLATPPARVAVVGAGMAGLAAALELEALGYDVTLLEAQSRSGGRNWTVRRGDWIADIDGSRQHCAFSPGQYLNAGPWRILPAHRRVLDYARQFGVALEPVAADRQAGSLRPVGGMDVLPRRMREAFRGRLISGARVHSVQRPSGRGGVIVAYRQTERETLMEADYVLLTLPLNLLARLQLPISEALEVALTRLQPADALKLAFELEGLPAHSPPAAEASPDWQLHWPQGEHPQQRIVSLYANGRALAHALKGADAHQLAFARAQIVARLSGSQELQAPLRVQWSRIPCQQAAAVRFVGSPDAIRQLAAGQPPLFFAGDGLSSMNGWQEGAVESAQQAVRQLHRFHAASA